MSFVSMSGSDVVIINGTILTCLGDENVAELDFPNEIGQVKTGKNGNSIYGFNAAGQQADLKLRVLRASKDDKYLNGLLAAQQGNFAGTVLVVAQLIKKIGDGQGNISNDIYVLGGGIFTKPVPAKSNVQGDTEQSQATYMLRFSSSPRAFL